MKFLLTLYMLGFGYPEMGPAFSQSEIIIQENVGSPWTCPICDTTNDPKENVCRRCGRHK